MREPVTLMGRGFGQLRSPAAPARRRQLGDDDAADGRGAGRAPVRATLTGDASLSRRPMRRVIEPLERMGARIEAIDGHAAADDSRRAACTRLHIARTSRARRSRARCCSPASTPRARPASPSRRRRAITPSARCARSAAPSSVDGLTVSVPAASVCAARRSRCPATSRRRPSGWSPRPPLPGSRVEIERRRTESDAHGPARRAAALRRARRGGDDRCRRRPTAASRAAPSRRSTIACEPLEIAPDEVPGLIDELPAIAALAAHGGEVTVRGAAELRVKESDRIAALVAGFRALGIDAEERARRLRDRRAGRRARRGRRRACRRARRSPDGDGLRDRGARGRAAVDHRRRGCRSRISYPGFFETLRRSAALDVRRREGRQDLPRRLHGGRQDDGGARAGASGWTGEAVDIDELIEQRERSRSPRSSPSTASRYFRAVERAGAHATSVGAPPPGRRDRRRHVRRSARIAPRSTPTASRSGSTCRSSALIARVPADGRRPLAADRAGVRTPVSSAARGLRAGAHPARRRARQRRRAGRTARRSGWQY